MKRKQPFTFDEFKNIYSKVPRLSVSLVIKTNKGILLILRQKHGWANQWYLPGGTVFYQEPIGTTIRRIAQEELGAKVNVERFLGCIEYTSEAIERGFGYSISLAFQCTLLDDRLDSEEPVEFFKKLPINTIREEKKLLTRVLKFKPISKDIVLAGS